MGTNPHVTGLGPVVPVATSRFDLLWFCRCCYANAGTDRCRFCGSPAPAAITGPGAQLPV